MKKYLKATWLLMCICAVVVCFCSCSGTERYVEQGTYELGEEAAILEYQYDLNVEPEEEAKTTKQVGYVKLISCELENPGKGIAVEESKDGVIERRVYSGLYKIKYESNIIDNVEIFMKPDEMYLSEENEWNVEVNPIECKEVDAFYVGIREGYEIGDNLWLDFSCGNNPYAAHRFESGWDIAKFRVPLLEKPQPFTGEVEYLLHKNTETEEENE